jgi:hypothetical protein
MGSTGSPLIIGEGLFATLGMKMLFVSVSVASWNLASYDYFRIEKSLVALAKFQG